MNSNRTAFIIDGLAVGGAEKFFLNLVNYFQQKGYRPFVVILTSDNPLLPEMDKAVEYEIIERSRKYDLTVGRRIKEKLIERSIVNVFCVHAFPFFLIKLYCLFEKRFRFFLSVHSTIPKSSRDFALNFGYYKLLQANDTVIYICKAQEKYLKKKYIFRKVNSTLIYNGIDTSFFNYKPEHVAIRNEVRARYNIPLQSQVIVKVARLAKEKGHTYAIEALKILRDKYDSKPFVLFVGSGEDAYVQKLHKLVEEYNLKKQVIFAGNHKDVRPFHYAADVFTLTSHSIETFSLAALEAMSSGTPGSLTNIGGAAEMITSDTGTLSVAGNSASIADSWYKTLTRKYDASVIHQHVENNFSLTKMLTQYESLIFVN